MSFALSKTVSDMNVEELSFELESLIAMDDRELDDYILKLSQGNKEQNILDALETQLFNNEVTNVKNSRQVRV